MREWKENINAKKAWGEWKTIKGKSEASKAIFNTINSFTHSFDAYVWSTEYEQTTV